MSGDAGPPDDGRRVGVGEGPARSRDAALQRARHGFVTGASRFGDHNVRITAGQVTREIDPQEAASIRRIFGMCPDSKEITHISQALNAQGATAPRAQQRWPNGWVPSSVHALL